MATTTTIAPTGKIYSKGGLVEDPALTQLMKGLTALQQIAEMYSPGGTIYKQQTESGESQYGIQKRKSMSAIAQSLVSSGLANTTALPSAELGYEQEVGVPFRTDLTAKLSESYLKAMTDVANYYGNVSNYYSTESARRDQLALQWENLLQQTNNYAQPSGNYMQPSGNYMQPSGNLQETKEQTGATKEQTGAQIAASMGGNGGSPKGSSTAGQTAKSITEIIGGNEATGPTVYGYGPMYGTTSPAGAKVTPSNVPTYSMAGANVLTYAQWKAINPKGTQSQYNQYYNSVKTW